MLIGWADYVSVDPQDQSRGKGGFCGEWFNVRGITDRAFATTDEAITAIKRSKTAWRDTGSWSGFDRVFEHPEKRGRFLCVGFGGSIPVYSLED